MIAFPKARSLSQPPVVRILGVGNAGVHLADRLTMSGTHAADIIAMNTDLQSLASSVTARKASLGEKATRGLGTGGDPEIGFEAAQESIEEIRFAVEGADLVFILAGLGGGTSSGATPVIAEAAREAGAIVFSLVTTPFAFEGRRRATQAIDALAALGRQSSAVLSFENDRMIELSSPRAGIGETFAVADDMLVAAVASIIGLLHGRGPMPVALGDLLTVVGARQAAALFGRGEATGDNRAFESLERALKSPLLDRGRLLSESPALLAHISGPPSLSFVEVSAIMDELGKNVSEDARLFLGVSLHQDPSAPVSVDLFGTHGGEAPAPAPVRVSRPVAKPVVQAPPRREAPPKAAPVSVREEVEEVQVPDSALFSPKPPGRLFADDDDDVPTPSVSSEPSVAVESPVPAPAPIPVTQRPVKPQLPKPQPAKVKQETLQFEPVARGRFEKSEPTIVEGEDLDVPTFLRLRGKK